MPIPQPADSFLVRLDALQPPAAMALDPEVFRHTAVSLAAELGRCWADTLRRLDADAALRADLGGILERIALVHARHADASPEPAGPRARAAVYAAAVLLLEGGCRQGSGG